MEVMWLAVNKQTKQTIHTHVWGLNGKSFLPDINCCMLSHDSSVSTIILKLGALDKRNWEQFSPGSNVYHVHNRSHPTGEKYFFLNESMPSVLFQPQHKGKEKGTMGYLGIYILKELDYSFLNISCCLIFLTFSWNLAHFKANHNNGKSFKN